MATAKTSGEGDLEATVVPEEPVPTPTDEPVPTPTEEPIGTPSQYLTGHLFQDPATLAVAVRTNIPDPYYDHEWGVMTVDRGGHYASWDEISGWTDRGPAS
jgi:hypothetical protein